MPSATATAARPADLLSSEQVTQEIPITTVTSVGKSWPHATFERHLRALMDRENIRDRAELSRLSGVSQTQLSNWRAGSSQPTMASLDKLAAVLDVPPHTLYIAADLISPRLLGMHQDVDLRVIPREIQDLLDLYNQADSSGQELIRQHVAFAVRGLSALLAEDPPAPETKPIRASPAS